MDFYSKFYKSEPIIESFKTFGGMPENDNNSSDRRSLVYVDATPRTIWHGDTWDEDFFNIPLNAPDILLPHKLYHVQPNAKFIVLLRNPTDRLVSDFKFYYRGSKSGETFHSKVVDAVSWWDKCISIRTRSTRACAYGKAPLGLPELGFEICMKNKTMTRDMRNYPYEFGDVCQSRYSWTQNAADRLRVSLYYHYIKDWLDTYPRENFLFIKFEDYIQQPAEYIDRHVLPFLGLPAYSSGLKLLVSNSSKTNKSRSKMVMLPETKIILDNFYNKSRLALSELLNDKRFLWN